MSSSVTVYWYDTHKNIINIINIISFHYITQQQNYCCSLITKAAGVLFEIYLSV